MCVDYLPYSDTSFPLTKATREGVSPRKNLCPYEWHSGAELFTCAEMWYEPNLEGMSAVSKGQGAWTYVKGTDFGVGAESIRLQIKGTGCVEIRLDQREATPLVMEGISEDAYSELVVQLPKTVSGVHDIYFVFSEKDICLKAWRAERKEQV